MNKKYSYKKIGLSAFVCVAIVLTILSSCAVRKTLQAYFSVPATPLLNHFKAVLPADNTCHFQETLSINSQEASSQHIFYPLPFLAAILFMLPELFRQSFFSQSNRFYFSSEGVPLFILYRQMKIFA